jgi:hypothetical protein
MSQSLKREEWDFSDLKSASPNDRYHAHFWEFQREALRRIGHREIPPPWLTLPRNKDPFNIGRTTPVRDLTLPYAPNAYEDVICIDYRFDIEEILDCFEKWLRQAYWSGDEPGPGRRDAHLAELWKLSIYRLLVVEGLTARQAQAKLKGTHLEERGAKLFSEETFHQAFSDAKRKASNEIETIADRFRTSIRVAIVLPLWEKAQRYYQ